MAKVKVPPRTDNELRRVVLHYFYDRNRTATSARSDKTGAAVKISVVNRELKAAHGLLRQEVRRNLTYLISQGWIEEKPVVKSVPLPTGTVIPQSTAYYIITAMGIDKVEGPGEFTVEKFKGIKIEATGQNIITVGDGNQVDARFGTVASALADLKAAMTASAKLSDSEKIVAVSDIDTLQSQLAKPEPNRGVVKVVWPLIEKAATVAGLIGNAAKVAGLLTPLLG